MNNPKAYGSKITVSQGTKQSDNTALTAVAIQDHLVKTYGLGDIIGPRRIGLGPAAKAKLKKPTRPVIDTGRKRATKSSKKPDEKDHEYVLDPKPPPLTLAQKLGLVEAPAQRLTELEWQGIKARSNDRNDSDLPCVICKEDFGFQDQVLLSCSHVFHKACLQAFERYSGRKTCPMCRKEQYQTRVIHEGAKTYKHKCAVRIQAAWRGYVVRCWYKKLREANPPKDPKLRQKFYEEKLKSITDRIVRSCDFHVNDFLRDIDQSLAVSRDVFRHFDAMFHQLSEGEWEEIQLKAVTRGDSDCPICLTPLVLQSYIEKNSIDKERTNTKELNTKPRQNVSHTLTTTLAKHQSSAKLRDKRKQTDSSSFQTSEHACENTNVNQSAAESIESKETKNRQTVLVSCSHVFHATCLQMFEELNVGESKHTCPVCRSLYQKRIIFM
ncbi:hypothetical protein CHS0354_022064 [Potamilus streckersoni]|uniref:RING-type domain-containing protein n=1 Tax=Potamilus streckersoni TaxID=2493646 RepID=A0AAE0W1Q3_9BIVA|nr:hypothetical protein CHS0354_022064 [Potamilus streckersoni]